MALTGELTDLSLAELIEFFCNQRKTGRLTVAYPQGPASFYLQVGSVVHASIGSLSGIEAVYYALTLSNASFNFNGDHETPEHTINQPWTSVVLEGLRRMDEGIMPRKAFADKVEPAVEVVPIVEPPNTIEPEPIVAPLIEQAMSVEPEPIVEPVIEPVIERAAAVEPEPIAIRKPAAKIEPKPVVESVNKQAATIKPEKPTIVNEPPKASPAPIAPPLSGGFLSGTDSASRFSYGPWKLGLIFAALILIVGVIAVPWGWYARGKAAKLANQTAPVSPVPVETSDSTASQQASVPETQESQTPEQTEAPATTSDTAEIAKREREARAREEARLRARAMETSASMPATQPAAPASSTSQPTSNAGSRKVVVQVTYDENGRVTQASGNDPTALRIARQKRFPAGKAGSATVTIPIN